MLRRTLLASLTFCAIGVAASIATAEDYPTRTITIIVPGSPGGAIDTVARLVGQQLSQAWGQPVVVDNKTGAANMIGTDFVAKSDPDGYTVLITAAAHAINPSLYKKMAFDSVKDFEPVILADTVPLLLVVPASLPVHNVQELIDLHQGPSRRGLVRLQRHRSDPAHVGRTVQGHRRRRDPARALQGQHLRPSGPDQRTGDDDVRYGGSIDATGAGGHVAATGSHHNGPGSEFAGRAHHDRGRRSQATIPAHGAASLSRPARPKIS